MITEFLFLGELFHSFKFTQTYLETENVNCALFINETDTLL